MSRSRCLVGAWLLIGQGVAAQEVLWQIPSPPSTSYLGPITPFVDYNGDGYRDLLHVVVLNYAAPGQALAFQILSGADGAILRQEQQWAAPVVYAGDMDGDGQPDIAMLKQASGVP